MKIEVVSPRELAKRARWLEKAEEYFHFHQRALNVGVWAGELDRLLWLFLFAACVLPVSFGEELEFYTEGR